MTGPKVDALAACVKALEPFAKLADELDDGQETCEPCHVTLPLAVFLAANAALALATAREQADRPTMEAMVEAGARYLAKDFATHKYAGCGLGEHMIRVAEHVHKHWQRYEKEARDFLTAALALPREDGSLPVSEFIRRQLVEAAERSRSPEPAPDRSEKCDGKCEGHEIVARIWTMFGSPTYEALAGRSIYDLIEDLQKRAPPRHRPQRVGEAADDCFRGFREHKGPRP